jgi:hypothetical protein
MKRSLLLISLIGFGTIAYCRQDNAGNSPSAVKKKTVTHHSKKHSKKEKTKQGEVIHYAPDQQQLDSIKKEKLKHKK